MVARGIDIGYGNVKFAVREDGGVTYRAFPSVVSMVSEGNLGGDMLAGKNVKRVAVGEEKYFVGPDAALMVDHGNGRVLTSDYTQKSHYLALVRGALNYMGEKKIDVLVTGLPVNHYHQQKEALAEALTGIHPCGTDVEVAIGKVHVLPQPVGGFLNYAASSTAAVKGTYTLIVDVGFYSMDWLVCRELKTIDQRCGSIDMGMSRYLTRLAQEVSTLTNTQFNKINRLDEAINGNGQLEWFGKKINLEPLYKKVSVLTDSACEHIANSVGDFSDISRVIVVGGGAKFYMDSINRMCRLNPTTWVEDGMYANVKGFQIAAERWARNG